MRYAICTTDPDTIADAREAGFDAVEVNVQTLIRPYDPEPVFEEALAPVLAAGLPIEAANVFLPKDLRCIGPDAVPDRIAEYAETVCRRLARAGASILVFGSGGARQRPEGWPKEEFSGVCPLIPNPAFAVPLPAPAARAYRILASLFCL